MIYWPLADDEGLMTMDEDRTPTARPGRERELASLYATAKSLTALGELDDVLSSIVRHAHDLIGTDFTYLSLLDEDGGLRLQATDSTISARFRAARIPRGTGVGGQVIASRTAQWVRNYADSGDIQHHPGFDSLVGDEGMVALLGVPLLVRGEAIGVLFAADRAEREFRADEIALLSAFADHAAVALDNARLYDESRSAVSRLTVAYQTIEEQVAVMERAQAVHEALTEVVLTGGGPQDVVQQLVGQMGGALTILDRDGTPVASGRAHDAAPETVDEDAAAPIRRAVDQAAESGRCATVFTDGGSHSAATIRAGESLLGTLVWSQADEPAPTDVQTLERATHIIGLLILKEDAVADAAERVSGELLTELLVASPEVSATQRARARSRGVDADALSLVVVAQADTVPGQQVTRRMHAIATEVGGLAGEHLGRPTMLLPASDPGETVRSVQERLRRELRQAVTVIGSGASGQDWGRAFSRATRCLAVADAIGASDVGSTTDQLALYGIVFDVERRDELDRFVSDTVGPLVEYDLRRSTDLLRTLDAYFDHGSNLRQTAAHLHVHLNTLLKRLDRAAVVLGADWRTGDDLALRLAVRLQMLRVRLGDDAPSRRSGV